MLYDIYSEEYRPIYDIFVSLYKNAHFLLFDKIHQNRYGPMGKFYQPYHSLTVAGDYYNSALL